MLLCAVMRRIIAWSGGKDSTGSVILAKQLGLQAEIVFVEVMYDKKRGISCENPAHMEFVHRTKKIFEGWGYPVTILRSDRDYLDCFNHVMDRARLYSENVGKRYGFPLNGMCVIQRDCKLRPMNQYLEQISEEYIQYVGICADEPKRLAAMHKKLNTRSLLEEHGITEDMTREMCAVHGLLSPTYEYSSRGGCWCCCNSKVAENAAIKQAMPDVWNQFVSLEKEDDLAHSRWNVFRETLAERDLKVDAYLQSV